jgi:hypothetical protein
MMWIMQLTMLVPRSMNSRREDIALKTEMGVDGRIQGKWGDEAY